MRRGGGGGRVSSFLALSPRALCRSSIFVFFLYFSQSFKRKKKKTRAAALSICVLSNMLKKKKQIIKKRRCVFKWGLIFVSPHGSKRISRFSEAAAEVGHDTPRRFSRPFGSGRAPPSMYSKLALSFSLSLSRCSFALVRRKRGDGSVSRERKTADAFFGFCRLGSREKKTTLSRGRRRRSLPHFPFFRLCF